MSIGAENWSFIPRTPRHRQGKPEPAPLANPRLQANFAPHQLHKRLADVQTQTSAAVGGYGHVRVFQAAKLLKKTQLVFGRNPRPGIGYGNLHKSIDLCF